MADEQNVDFFLKLEGVVGESQDSTHQGEIDVLDFNYNVYQPGTMGYAGGGGTGKVAISLFTITCRQEKAVETLKLKSSKGDHVPSGQFTARKAGGEQQEYLKIFFKDLILTSVNQGGSSGSPQRSVNLSFDFAAFKSEYYPQKGDGSLDAPITFEWDCKKNIPVFPG